MRLSRLAPVALAALALLSVTPAMAAPIEIVGCTAGCTGVVTVSNQFGVPLQSNSGNFNVDPVTGDLSLAAPITVTGPDYSASIDSITGNQDPVLIFSTSATNLTAGLLNYSFTFSLPINLPEPIIAQSSVNYALTDGLGDGVTLSAPASGFVVDSEDRFNNPPNPALIRDKGVDVGPSCTRNVPGGGAAPICGPYTAGPVVFGSIGGPTYNEMRVVVAFGLTPFDVGGATGTVRQDPIPEPGTAGLLGAGLAALALARRRRQIR
jgi:hypothetical protein